MRKNNEQEKHLLAVNNENYALLQTANGYIADVKEINEVAVKIIFDSCSQQTYVTQKVAKKLNLKPIRKFKMAVNLFGKGHEVLEVNEYSVCVKPQERNTSIYINVVAVPTIDTP